MPNKFHPLDERNPDYVAPDEGTINAIRKCIADWCRPNPNWAAVFQYLRAAGRPVDEINAMTSWRDVRAAFDTGQRVFLDLVGQARTNESTVQRFDFDAAAVVNKRHGRLPKEESDIKRTALLATIRQHPTLVDDPAKLAQMNGVSESTARRWVEEERQKYTDSAAARPEPDEE